MTLEAIQVSPNHRFLTTASGLPFFWLADTAWELFHRLDRAEAAYYLDIRRKQGFTVIQAVVLAELDGLHTPNANGHLPLLGDDPIRPNEFYFRFVDDIIRMAADKGLYIGLLPTWGDKVHGGLWGTGPVIFTSENARAYGHYLGQRYRNDPNIVWILGGDRPASGYEAVWTGLAEGITAGLGYRPLFTYHPNGGASSSAALHDAPWLDLHMLQSGHALQDAPNWEMITADYVRSPVKPVLDGEPNYEDHPIDPFRRTWQVEFGRFRDYDVRKQAYRAVFAGACGHTYGHHAVWQFWTLQRKPINFPMPTWQEALLAPGATQLIHFKQLLLSRPYLSRIPAQEMLVGEAIIGPANKNAHHDPMRAAHPRATRCADGTYALVYVPQAEQQIRVDLRVISGAVNAWWFDPRNGKGYSAGTYPNDGVVAFTSPIAGPDWVLVLDDTAHGFPAPGVISDK
ncbi:MAG: glycoside hydrolase family 140 protein [Chloroflexota bacterium]|nr:glycoside hydrolase family 140 protein [Chloroflexota bacterium]PLS83301.1 MAG: hypothetical protein CYG59_01735 [Chloroflexota bacterium]